MSDYVDFHKQPAPPSALGMATLNPALGVAGLVGGGLGGGMLGQSLASSAIGPYETEEEKFERMLAARESAQLKMKNKEKAAMSLHSFGAKLANVTGMTYDPDNANVKRLKEQHPDNWQQIMAESQGLSDASQAKAIKKAQSACSPCAMPNAPTNKKPYTSASPAVTDASQKSEEVGKPPVTETEHSEAKAKLPEEGVKSAIEKQANPLAAFGKMVGQGVAKAAPALMGAAKPAVQAASKIKITPQDLAARAQATAGRTGNNVVMTNPATGVQETLARAGGDLKPSWLRNQEAVARGIDPKTGVRPGSVAPTPAPPPPAPGKVTVSPAEAAAGRSKITITPDEAAAGYGKLKITPEELRARAQQTAQRTGRRSVITDPNTGVQRTLAEPGGTAVPQWVRQQQAIQRGIDPKTGVRPGSVAPTPPPPPPAPGMIKTQSAIAFGAKVAESIGASVANYGGPRNMLDSVIDTGVKGVNAVKSIPGKIWSAGEAIANYGGPRNAMDSVIDAGVAARNGVGSAMQTLKDSRGLIPRTGEAIANYGGPRNALDTVIDAGVAARNGVGSALTGLNNARLSAGRQLGEMWAAGGDDGGRGYQGPPGSTPQVSGKVGPKPDAAGAGTGAAGGGILETLYNNPGYTAAGGLGALGLGGLLYYLNSQPKKKKRDEEEV